MQVITEDFLALGLIKNDSINDSQLKLLGLNSENSEDYESLSLGKSITDASAELFVLLRGISAKTNQSKIITNYKALQQFRKAPKAKSTTVNSKIEATSGDVVLYCDGGCSPNPGKSGSGVALYRNNQVSELWYGLFENMGTNNTAELNALYQSLLMAKDELAKDNGAVIKCDSMYSINCISLWAKGWEKNGWKKKGGEIKNLDIIKQAYHLYNSFNSQVKLEYIKAHAGHEGNELADRMTHYARVTQERTFKRYKDDIDVAEVLAMGEY